MSWPSVHPHVLVVSAVPALGALFADVLTDDGYRVSRLTAVPTNLAFIAGRRPDLLLLSDVWRTPAACCALLRRLADDTRTAALPVVLCTSRIQEIEALQVLGHPVVPQPFELDDLLAVIAAQLHPVPGHLLAREQAASQLSAS